MGQVLNTVVCPVCQYSSRNFDPFNLLSIPIPTVADVIFKVVLVRRSSFRNCPWVLDIPRKGVSQTDHRFLGKKGGKGPGAKVPSEYQNSEQYYISISRLADCSDLRVRIQNLCGISANRLQLCRAEELENDEDDETVLGRQIRLPFVNDKEGPCSQLVRRETADENSWQPTTIVAFESTIQPRQYTVKNRSNKSEKKEDETITDNEDEEETAAAAAPDEETVKRHLAVYGDEKECRVLDSDPVLLSKAISRKNWPTDESGFHIGLRVDARDHRGHWFTGSVVDVFDEKADDGGGADTGEEKPASTKKVTVHFDGYESKWDDTYSYEQFKDGTVKPFASHASPRRPLEVHVYHRHKDMKTGHSVFFGQPFYVQCFNEWTNARAGAQILAQLSRYLNYESDLDSDKPEIVARTAKLYSRTSAILSDFIDVLIDFDREFIRLSLGKAENGSKSSSRPDLSTLSSALAKKVSDLSSRLPIEIRMANCDPSFAEKTSTSLEDEAFPFDLSKKIVNYMIPRGTIVIQWRDPPPTKHGPGTSRSIRAPVLYIPPVIRVHRGSEDTFKKIVEDRRRTEKARKNRPGGGMDLGVCLTEFCKMQKLSLSSNWRCPQCKDYREGSQDMNLWRLPDLLMFHIKRFNMSARWREKISTKVDFPLTGLDMSEWCHKESPALQEDPIGACTYDLIGVMNHYGSMTGGHYVATCKATVCGREGKEEVAYGFNGSTAGIVTDDMDTPTTWRLPVGRPKSEVNHGKVATAMSSKSVADTHEPMWLQFDDELVEPIPPESVVSEMAYVLFYRRRRMTPSNIARYSTLD